MEWIKLIVECIVSLWSILDLKKINIKLSVVIIIVFLSFSIVGVTKVYYKNEKIHILYSKNIDKTIDVRDEKNNVIARLTAFTKIEVIDKSPVWVKIEFSNKKIGWIEEKYIQEIKNN